MGYYWLEILVSQIFGLRQIRLWPFTASPEVADRSISRGYSDILEVLFPLTEKWFPTSFEKGIKLQMLLLPRVGIIVDTRNMDQRTYHDILGLLFRLTDMVCLALEFNYLNFSFTFIFAYNSYCFLLFFTFTIREVVLPHLLMF